MKLYGISLLPPLLPVVLALAGCDSGDAPVAPPSAPVGAVARAPEVPVMGPERRILALGDSLFAGYGVERGQGYPERLEAALRARGVNARIANAGVSGDTTAGGRQRLAFTLDSQERAPDLVVISLGGNDMLRGLPPQETRANLDAILAELKRRRIPAVLMGMLSPPNLGADYRGQFDPIYPALARKYDAALVPFFLSPVFGKPGLVQTDRIHPTAEGIAAMVAATAGTVADKLPPAKPG
ncbi:MAG TPA: arylesterase [Novosphingobium sp.]